MPRAFSTSCMWATVTDLARCSSNLSRKRSSSFLKLKLRRHELRQVGDYGLKPELLHCQQPIESALVIIDYQATRIARYRTWLLVRGGIADSYRMSTTAFAVTDYSRCGRLLSPYPSMSTIITATTPSVSVRVTDRRRQRRASVRSPKEPLARPPLAFADPRCAWAHPVYVYPHDPGLVL